MAGKERLFTKPEIYINSIAQTAFGQELFPVFLQFILQASCPGGVEVRLGPK